jgi:hypothetical protein
VATVHGELNSALDWLNTLENSLLDSLREKSPLRTIDLTRAAWRKVLEREGANTAESQEVGDPREYSIVSVNAMLLDLARRGLVMVQNVSPGYANPTTRMVENPWTVPKFTDPFGNVQDYPSTKEGLDEGVRRDVFEIHAHRAWTHLNWDLDSPPGPWWDGPIEGEQAHPDWYNETVDVRRGLPVPSNDMLFIYKTGRDAIQRQFGATPLAVTVRQGRGLEHDNGRLAVMAGYGVGRWTYLGPDHVIRFSIPQMAPEQVGCHDIDLVAKNGCRTHRQGR